MWIKTPDGDDHNTPSAWKDILHKYSDSAIQAIAQGDMRIWEDKADDYRQRAALEILFNREVDADINKAYWACQKCGCAYAECEC